MQWPFLLPLLTKLQEWYQDHSITRIILIRISFPLKQPYTIKKYESLKDFVREFVHMKVYCLQTRVYPWGQLAGREQCV